MRARRDPGGFTLLEAMLAVTILGIVATALYGSFSRALASRALAERRIEVVRTGRSALARMADDLTAAVAPPDGAAPLASALFRSLPGGSEDAPLDAVTFSTLASRPSGLEGRGAGRQVISYFFASSPDAMRGDRAPRDATDVVDFFATFPPRFALPEDATPERLLRRAEPVVGADELAPVPATLFLDNVAGLRLRFYDGRAWLDDWDSRDRTYPAPLPRAVEIDLALYDATGAVHHFATAVDLPLAQRSGGRGLAPATQPTPASGGGPSQRGRAS